MKVLHKKFPSCFITGVIPPTCFSPKTDRKGKLKPPPTLTQNVGVEWYNSQRILFMNENICSPYQLFKITVIFSK